MHWSILIDNWSVEQAEPLHDHPFRTPLMLFFFTVTMLQYPGYPLHIHRTTWLKHWNSDIISQGVSLTPRDVGSPTILPLVGLALRLIIGKLRLRNEYWVLLQTLKISCEALSWLVVSLFCKSFQNEADVLELLPSTLQYIASIHIISFKITKPFSKTQFWWETSHTGPY